MKNEMQLDLEAAWDEQESKEAEGITEDGGEAIQEASDSGESSATEEPPVVEQEDGSAEPKETEAEPEPDPETEPETEPEPDAESKDAGDATSEEDGIKAPIGYSPEAREEWGKVPAKVKEQIHEREKQIAEAMHGTAEARKVYDTMSEMVGNYHQVLAAEGAETPLDALNGIVNTVAVLRMGSPQQKAETLAGLVSHYGVDIQALDSALAGEAPQEGTATDPNFESLIDQKLQPINQVMEQLAQMQQQKEQQTQEQTTQSIQQFAEQNEFFADVREDMADLFDLASKRGAEITLQQAYDKACAMHPQISGILAKRQQEASILDTNQALAAKVDAASSVAGGQQPPTERSVADPNTSLYEDIAAVWDQFN